MTTTVNFNHNPEEIYDYYCDVDAEIPIEDMKM
jgi:hypothetical protein